MPTDPAEYEAAMEQFLDSPMMNEFLGDPEKIEQSRQALLNNPMAMNMMKSMPGFDEIINDKDKFREHARIREAVLEDMKAERAAARGGAAASEFDDRIRGTKGGHRSMIPAPHARSFAGRAVDAAAPAGVRGEPRLRCGRLVLGHGVLHVEVVRVEVVQPDVASSAPEQQDLPSGEMANALIGPKWPLTRPNSSS